MFRYLIFVLFIFSFYSFSYFEDRYWCKIENKKVTVLLKKVDNSVKCLDILKNIYTKQKKLDQSIKYAYQNYKTYHTSYWKNLYEHLLNTRKSYEILSKEIRYSIKKFETQFFNKIKEIINLWYKREHKKLLDEYNVAKTHFNESFYSGNVSRFKYYRSQIDKIIYKLFLLNKIISSQSFEQLIPLLKKYIELGN